MAAETWSDEQNDVIVARYFAMMASDIAGSPYNKAQHNRHLQGLTGRSRGSIEYKLQNVSAVLKGLGEDWIPGYKPAFNFQASLVDAVARWLDVNPSWRAEAGVAATADHLADQGALWLEPPPTVRNAPPPAEQEQMLAIARKFDVAARDAHNRSLGRAGEARVLAHERATLRVAGRRDLADRVRWISEEEGDGAGYDIASFAPDGDDRLVEVKTTNGWERTPFHVTRTELAVADQRREHWCLVRLWNFTREPRAFEIRPPLEAHVLLTPTSFQASFR